MRTATLIRRKYTKPIAGIINPLPLPANIHVLKLYRSITILFLVAFCSCGKTNRDHQETAPDVENSISHASGLAIFDYGSYSLVTVNHPWPNSTEKFNYILKQKDAVVPDSLKGMITINVPVKNIIVTSTTHIPSLEMLGVGHTLTGFPNLSYISSEGIRKRIDEGKIRELGSNQSLNMEVAIDLQPDVIIGYGIDNSNPMLDKLEKAGLKILVNGDWNEESPLGKAEWIKLYGTLYGLEGKANAIFSDIEKAYNHTLELAKQTKKKPTVIAGAVYENRWYLPQGKSWGALSIKDAGGQYLWADTDGTGSLSLPFETVLEKGKNADFWIGPGQFTSLKEMLEANPHYGQFEAFKRGNVYSFSTKKGKTGGIIYYELAPNRPDLVLKDVLKILHPELLPDYELFFFKKLK